MVNIRPRYPQYRSKISVRYEGFGGLIGTEGAKGIWGRLCGSKFVVWMLARTPNSHPTPAHLPDIGGDIPAAAAHSSADLIKGIENKWGNKKIVHAYHHMMRTTFFGVKKVLRQKNKRGGGTCWCPKSPNSSDQNRKWKFLCTLIDQVVISNQQQQLVLEHFLLISNLKIQIWNTGISFLFDHVVPSMAGRPFVEQRLQFL